MELYRKFQRCFKAFQEISVGLERVWNLLKTFESPWCLPKDPWNAPVNKRKKKNKWNLAESWNVPDTLEKLLNRLTAPETPWNTLETPWNASEITRNAPEISWIVQKTSRISLERPWNPLKRPWNHANSPVLLMNTTPSSGNNPEIFWNLKEHPWKPFRPPEHPWNATETFKNLLKPPETLKHHVTHMKSPETAWNAPVIPWNTMEHPWN